MLDRVPSTGAAARRHGALELGDPRDGSAAVPKRPRLLSVERLARRALARAADVERPPPSTLQLPAGAHAQRAVGTRRPRTNTIKTSLPPQAAICRSNRTPRIQRCRKQDQGIGAATRGLANKHELPPPVGAVVLPGQPAPSASRTARPARPSVILLPERKFHGQAGGHEGRLALAPRSSARRRRRTARFWTSSTTTTPGLDGRVSKYGPRRPHRRAPRRPRRGNGNDYSTIRPKARAGIPATERGAGCCQSNARDGE